MAKKADQEPERISELYEYSKTAEIMQTFRKGACNSSRIWWR